MKFFTVLSFCLTAITIQAQIWDCNCDIDPDSNFICASDSEGNIIPVPNQCFADCFNLTVLDSVDCLSDFVSDDIDFTFDCDCDESDFESEGICISVLLSDSLITASGIVLSDSVSFETWVPSECYAECLGFNNFVILDCDSIWNDDWEWDDEWDDPFGCDCDESDWEGEGICIEVTLADSILTGTGLGLGESVFETWVPSECFAECWGYADYKIVDCDSIWNDDWEWDDEWDDPFGCDCEESDWEGEGICIEVTFSDSILTGTGLGLGESVFETWVPSECFAECWGYTDYEIVDCDSIWNDDWEWDDEWDDPFGCDCDESDWEGEGICIEVTFSDSILTGTGLGLGESVFETWVPSECFAECWGYIDYEIVDCDSIWNDDWEWDDEWDDPFGCECDESDWEGEGICIEVTFSDSILTGTGLGLGESVFETWVPSECFAECWGYTDYVLVDCDSIYNEEIDWIDCDCEYHLEDEPVCVLTDTITGEICPFPNMCYAECAGYTLDDVVDCEDVMAFDCIECFDSEINPVCVVDLNGDIFPVPNNCFADCLGLEVIEDESCGGFELIDDSTSEFEVYSPEIHRLKSVDLDGVNGINIFPNPVSEFASLHVQTENEIKIDVVISSLSGERLISRTHELSTGFNTMQIDVSKLAGGIYLVNFINGRSVHTEKLIKL